MLEMMDRLGIFGILAAFDPATTARGEALSVHDMPERIAPVAPEHALPFIRETVATFANDVLGLKASARRDFKKKSGALVAAPGKVADFIVQVLTLAGWDVTAAEVAESYQMVLMKREWTRRPRPKPRPRPRRN